MLFNFQACPRAQKQTEKVEIRHAPITKVETCLLRPRGQNDCTTKISHENSIKTLKNIHREDFDIRHELPTLL
jgi:hypothetical protein